MGMGTGIVRLRHGGAVGHQRQSKGSSMDQYVRQGQSCRVLALPIGPRRLHCAFCDYLEPTIKGQAWTEMS